MEKSQKVETEEKAVIEGEKIEVEVNASLKVNTTEIKEDKMEVDIETVKDADQEKEYVIPLVLKAEPESEDLVNLIIEGIEYGDDDDEEFVIMTPEEIRIFLEQKISEQVRDPKVNPLLALQKQSQDLLNDIRYKADEIARTGKTLEILYKNQERFLRHVDIFPKIPTNNVSASVDLPVLLDSVPLGSTSKAPNEEAVIRKDLSDSKVLSPSVSKTKSVTSAVPSSAPVVPNSTPVAPTSAPVAPNSTPVVPKSISITPVPNANSAAPTVPNTSSAAPPKSPVSNLTTTVKSLPKLPPKQADDIECIDLTDDTPITVAKPVTNSSPLAALSLVKHPAPLPPKPFCAPNNVLPNTPPKPRLKISSEERGIVLQWDMPPSYSTLTAYSKLKAFDIFGYQEQKNVTINTLLWKKIGSVKAMNLPMACTLTQFTEGQKYHFAIRAVDVYDRYGSYSDPISIVYKPNNAK